ncbi:hypothetical protein FVA77_25405 [Phyllobacterium endophyticum]|nr:hypothetical protein FVA77_25405 [Phyllobacterium endophyticum]
MSNIDDLYSRDEWRILELAHQKACRTLERDPRSHPYAERLVCLIMILFERGERDYRKLADLAVKREINLLEAEYQDETGSGFAEELMVQTILLKGPN